MESHRVFWEDPQPVNGHKLEFDGVPFMLTGTAVCDCYQGKDGNVAVKARIKGEKNKMSKQIQRGRVPPPPTLFSGTTHYVKPAD